jgi:hypothetical protein
LVVVFVKVLSLPTYHHESTTMDFKRFQATSSTIIGAAVATPVFGALLMGTISPRDAMIPLIAGIIAILLPQASPVVQADVKQFASIVAAAPGPPA